MEKTNQILREPFLFRFKETDRPGQGNPVRLRPQPSLASNPKEEAPKPEPTKKGPWGD